jgi:UDP-N-acetyl-D-galactosamine dehydrogenase
LGFSEKALRKRLGGVGYMAKKFNFLKYKPGLVGGHCISVDPYYLSHKAVQLGYHPNVILSGRRVNDSMAEFVASKAVKMMIKKKKTIDESTVLILGITFKENCPDIRNTKVVDVYRELKEYGVEVVIYDPWANPEEVFQEYGIKSCQNINECFSGTEALEVQTFDAVIVAVAHREFLQMDVKGLLNKQGVLFDLKACLDQSIVDARL